MATAVSEEYVHLREKILTCLSQQLEELETLQSMYPDKLVISDSTTLNTMKNYIDGPTEYVPAHLSYMINIKTEDLQLEVCVSLPTFYPVEAPDILVRCNQLNRKQQTELNCATTEYLNSIDKGESCIYSVIMWLQDNCSNFYATKSVESTKIEKQCLSFARFWIYSHHIYSKRKRDEIVSAARQFDLTGFCIPGKPGIICVEGNESDCEEWWKNIKSMTWKKISLRKTEVFVATDFKRLFGKFEEKPMDMKCFSKFLHDHGVIEIFEELFVICNEHRD